MWDYKDLVCQLQEYGMLVNVETQGSIWKDWLGICDMLTISPKGPGMGDDFNMEQFHQFMEKTIAYKPYAEGVCLKIVVFGEKDLEFAKEVWKYYPKLDLYLSLGNPILPGDASTKSNHRDFLLQQYDSIANLLYDDPVLCNAIFLPQLHVLVWSNEQEK